MIRVGNIITTPEIAAKLSKSAIKIKSWDNKAFQTVTFQHIRTMGLYFESVFDAAHGCRYMLFLLHDRCERKQAYDFICGVK